MALRCRCGTRFDTSTQLATHIKKYNHEIQCSSCHKFLKSQDALLNHFAQTGHSSSGAISGLTNFSCTCGKVFKSAIGLQDHQRDTQHSIRPSGTPAVGGERPLPDLGCHLCKRRFASKDVVKAHKAEKHPSCPICEQQFETSFRCMTHQRAMGHCFCRDHGAAFSSEASYKKHLQRTVHVTNYECLDCDRRFDSEVALDDHLASPGHSNVLQAMQHAAELEEAARATEAKSLRCEECKRDFKTLQGCKAHNKSARHKPLSDLVCPVSHLCKKRFTLPSALLLHLESGGCKSGMNRHKLNVLIHAHDSNRQVTHDENVTEVLSTATAANSMPTASDLATSLQALSIAGLSAPPKESDAISETTTTCEGILVEDISDVESITSGVLVRTPSISSPFGGVELMSEGSDSEWSFVDAGLATPSATSVGDSAAAMIQYDAASKSWPCIVEGCRRTFKKESHLMRHLYSPYHAPKLFHCPTGLVMEGEEHEKVFKTMSGFAMHLESGNRVGGKEALQKIVGIFEKKIEEATGNVVKLLKESSD